MYQIIQLTENGQDCRRVVSTESDFSAAELRRSMMSCIEQESFTIVELLNE